MTTSTDATTTNTTVTYFKERYEPLYRYADGAEFFGTIVAWLGGFGGFIFFIPKHHSNQNDNSGLVFFVGMFITVTLALGFYMACRLVAAMARAFADIAVGTAPGLDDAGRLAVIRNGPRTDTKQTTTESVTRDVTEKALTTESPPLPVTSLPQPVAPGAEHVSNFDIDVSSKRT